MLFHMEIGNTIEYPLPKFGTRVTDRCCGIKRVIIQHFGMPTFFLHVECNHSTKSLSGGYVTRAQNLQEGKICPRIRIILTLKRLGGTG